MDLSICFENKFCTLVNSVSWQGNTGRIEHTASQTIVEEVKLFNRLVIFRISSLEIPIHSLELRHDRWQEVKV
jgi:hypothetical protein